MTTKIEVDITDALDQIVRESLKTAYYCNNVELDLLKAKAKDRELRNFEKEDFDNCKKLRKAFKRAHNYFADWEDHI